VALVEKIKCPRPKCGGQLTVPIKLVRKGTDIVDVAACPNCHKKYKIYFNANQKDEVAQLFKDSIYYCDVCGTDNHGNFVEGETWEMDRRKIVVRCKNCGKKRAKVVTETILKKIESLKEAQEQESRVENEPADSVEQIKQELRQCPSCGAMCDPEHLFCSSCGTPLLCPKCQKPLPLGAKFCMSCGTQIS